MNATQQGKLVAQFKNWLLNPLEFVEQFIGASPTPQQRDACVGWGDLIKAKLKKAANMTLSPYENSIVGKLGMSIESGQGTGKDALAAWLVIHFLVCTHYPRILCTAPTESQLRTVLWAEIHRWMRESKAGNDILTWQSEKIFLKEEGGHEWFAVPRTVSKSSDPQHQAETLAGLHAPFMLYVVDEAAGCQDPVFQPMEGSATQKCNLVLLIYNPTKSYGYAFESQRKNRRDWMCYHWSSEESPLVSREHIERMRAKYGVDSNPYRIRVLGLPPTADPDSLVPWDHIIRATERVVEPQTTDPLGIGVDVARMGDDKTVLLVRHGYKILTIEEYKNLDGIQAAERVQSALFTHLDGCAGPSSTAVDIIGVGASVYDQLNRYCSIPGLMGVNVSESPAMEDKFERLRDEVLWHVREEFEQGLPSIPDNHELMHQLNVIKYKINPNGKIKVEGKAEMKRRGQVSPNHLDAYALAKRAVDMCSMPAGLASRSREYNFRRSRQTGNWAVG